MFRLLDVCWAAAWHQQNSDIFANKRQHMSSTDETNQAFYFWGILVSGYTFQKGCVPERGLLGQVPKMWFLSCLGGQLETPDWLKMSKMGQKFFPPFGPQEVELASCETQAAAPGGANFVNEKSAVFIYQLGCFSQRIPLGNLDWHTRCLGVIGFKQLGKLHHSSAFVGWKGLSLRGEALPSIGSTWSVSIKGRSFHPRLQSLRRIQKVYEFSSAGHVYLVCILYIFISIWCICILLLSIRRQSHQQ